MTIKYLHTVPWNNKLELIEVLLLIKTTKVAIAFHKRFEKRTAKQQAVSCCFLQIYLANSLLHKSSSNCSVNLERKLYYL